MILQSDEKILIAVSFNTYNSASTSTGIARLNNNGNVDTSFAIDSGLAKNSDYIIGLQSGGKIFGGERNYTYYNGKAETHIFSFKQ